MAALCEPRIALAFHVPRAESGEAALFRRHPASRRRVSAVSRSLSAAGFEAAADQSGVAYPCRKSAAAGSHYPILDAADLGVLIQCLKRRDAVGFHQGLPPGR